MEEVTICGVQFESKVGDIDANIEKAIDWLEKADSKYDADLVVFPESASTGYNTGLSASELNELVDEIPGETTRPIMEAAARLDLHVIWPTYEPAPSGKVYQSAALIDNLGEVLGVYRKVHPFPAEKEWTEAGNSVEVYDTDIGRIGMMICFDGDFAELARLMGKKGADIIVRPSAFLRSYETWSMTNAARAYDCRAYLVAPNQVGIDAGDTYYYGHSMIVTPQGRKVAQALSREEIVHTTVDPSEWDYASYGNNIPMLSDHIEMRNEEAYEGLI
ncbi:MAG: carbon-nitrogen hydrolase family protein [bacterium]